MKGSKSFFKLEEKDHGDVFWNKTSIKAFGGNKFSFNDAEDDKKNNIQAKFTSKNSRPKIWMMKIN